MKNLPEILFAISYHSDLEDCKSLQHAVTVRVQELLGLQPKAITLDNEKMNVAMLIGRMQPSNKERQEEIIKFIRTLKPEWANDEDPRGNDIATKNLTFEECETVLKNFNYVRANAGAERFAKALIAETKKLDPSSF